jgi:hypothetical protein
MNVLSKNELFHEVGVESGLFIFRQVKISIGGFRL